jgi:glycosyltransferase involved in cell wall biosynthesis
VIDNGSTDDTESVVRGIKDGRIKYLRNPEPTGSCDVPRNVGMKLAKGTFIAFLDDDDIWYPLRLERVKRAFEENPDASCVCHDENRRINGQPAGVIHCGPWSEDLHERLLYEGNRLSSCGTTIRLDALRRFNGFDERAALSEVADFDLWIRMARDGAKSFFIPEALGEFNLTGRNWSAVNPYFAAKQAEMVKNHILEYEGKPLFQVSGKGLSRLFQLYFIAGRNFLRKHYFKKVIFYLSMCALFVMRRPSLIMDLYSKMAKKGP